MGCTSSTPSKNKDVLDDSLHRNLVRDRKKKVDNIYSQQDQLASGTGTKIILVKKQKFIKTQHSGYAMKRYDGTSDLPPDLQKEAEILQLCDHPNIVKLHELGKHGKHLTLVLEYCKGGTVESNFPYTEKEASKIIWQVLTAVDFLHKKSIVHRDLNLSNMMFESEIRISKDEVLGSDVKVIDFGCATKLKIWTQGAFKGSFKFLEEQTGGIYTMAPEVIKGKYSTQADMWSVGVCAYMLMSNGKRPFEGDTVEKTQTKIKCNAIEYSEIKSKKAVNFIKKCLDYNPSTRLTASQALRDPWVHQTKEKVIMPNDMVASFQKFMRSTPVKRIAYNVLARKADPKAITKYRDIFRNLDTIQSNTLTRLEFVTGFGAAGFAAAELEDLFTKLDINCNNEIFYTEFLAGTMSNDEVTEVQIYDAFEQMDTDSSGYISKKNLVTLLGNSPSVKESLSVMLKGHQNLSYSNFRELFVGNSIIRSLHSFDESEEENDLSD